MSWTAPMTAVDNTKFTAAQFNTYVRDNLNATMPGMASSAGNLLITSPTAPHTIVERALVQAVVATSEATTSNTYTDLATVGPSMTINTGTAAIVFWAAMMQTATTNTEMEMAYAVSGATTVAATDNVRLMLNGVTSAKTNRLGRFYLHTGLNAGTNTFTAKYRTNSSVSATFQYRLLGVMAL